MAKGKRDRREQVYTIEAAADYLGCSVTTIRREIASGELRAYRVSSRVIRIAESWLRDYQESHQCGSGFGSDTGSKTGQIRCGMVVTRGA